MNLANASHIAALGGELFPVTKEASVLSCGLNHPTFTSLSCPTPSSDAATSRIVQSVLRKYAGTFRWICSRSLPGANRVIHLVGMSLDFANFTPARPSVAKFTYPRDLTEWSAVVTKVSTFSQEDIQKLLEKYRKSPFFYHIVAYIDGLPVGAGTLHMWMGVAFLHHISVRPQARGKGVASDLVSQLLKLAQQLSASTCHIFATESAARMYERLGFEVNIPHIHGNIFEHTPAPPAVNTPLLSPIEKQRLSSLPSLTTLYGSGS